MDNLIGRTPLRAARPAHFVRHAAAAMVLALCALSLAACATRHHGPQRGFERPGGIAFAGQVMVQPIALLFSDYDRDRDRRLTEAELKAGMDASFAEADADKSGTIGALEFQAWAEKALGSKDAMPGFLRFDTDMSSAISRDELVKTLTGEFTRFDANKDSVLERGELVSVSASAAGRGEFRERGEGGDWSRGGGGGRRRGGGD